MSFVNTTTQIPAAVPSFFSKMLLVRARPMLHHQKVAQVRRFGRRMGNTMVFRRFEPLSLALAALGEGVTPTGDELSKTDISTVLQQYGNYVPVSDVIDYTVESPVLREAVTLLAENAADTLDALHRDVYVAGTNVQYGGTATSRAELLGTAHKVSTGLLDRMIRFLNQQNAKPFTSKVRGGDREFTYGLRPAFWAIISPEILFTLENLQGYKSVEEYGSGVAVMEGEVGIYKNLRFLLSTQAKTFPGGGGTASGDVKKTSTDADVHTILAFGQNAVGTVPLEGANTRAIIKPLGSAGTADPLNQRATVGWKFMGSRLRLNENFMVRGEVTVGDVAP